MMKQMLLVKTEWSIQLGIHFLWSDIRSKILEEAETIKKLISWHFTDWLDCMFGSLKSILIHQKLFLKIIY